MINRSFIIFAFVLFPFFTESRWASQKDASLRYDLWRSLIKVEKDGSYTEDIKFKVKILKDSAVHSFGNFLLTYNESSQKVKILSAKTIKKGKSFPVNLKFIEDKPLASSPAGFDQTRQILIAFPHVEPGVEVYLHYRFADKIPPYKGFFSYSKTFQNKWFQKAELEIQSDLPLYYKLNDPESVFKISDQTQSLKKQTVPLKNFFKLLKSYAPQISKKKYNLKLSLKRSLFKHVLDEKHIFTNLDLMPWIEVASDKKWSGMVQHLAGKYQNRIAEILPKLYQKILKSAQQFESGSKDQINFVMSSLIEKIRYMGDWRPIDGGFVPRPLSTIVKTGFGDCKDLSVSLSAILNRLGFKAQVALVLRSPSYHSSYEYKLPNKKAFNHAIVYAKVKDKIFWLDPTNVSVYSQGPFVDFADRPALVLESPIPKMTKTPKLKSDEAEHSILRNFRITKKDQAEVTGSINFKGRSAIAWTGADLNKSKESIDYELIRYAGVDISTLKKWTVGEYDLSSRIVKDFSVQMSYLMAENNDLFGYKTQLGSLFFSPYPANIRLFFVRVRNRVSDLFLGPPRKMIIISKLLNIKPLGKFNFNCHIESKWLEAKRRIKTSQPFTIKDTYEFKQTEIPVEEMKSKEFAEFQKKLKRCFAQSAMIYKRTN